jgi:hypothetical protein
MAGFSNVLETINSTEVRADSDKNLVEKSHKKTL